MIEQANRDVDSFFLLGTYPTPPNIACAKVGSEAGIPIVTAGAAGVVVYEQRLRNIFGVMSPARGFLNNTLDMMLASEVSTSEVPSQPGHVSIPIPRNQKPNTFVFITSDDFGAIQDAITTSRYGKLEYGIDAESTLVAMKGEVIPGLKPASFKIDGLNQFRIVQQAGPPSSNPSDPGGTHNNPLIAYVHPESKEAADAIGKEFPKLLGMLDQFSKNNQAIDVISLTGHMPQGIAFVEAGAKVWPSPRNATYPKGIIMSVGPGNPAFTNDPRVGANARNLIGASVWSSRQRHYGHDEFIESQSFHDKFLAKFHREPSYLTAGAVVCGIVYEEAFRRAQTIEPKLVRDALQSISDSRVHHENFMAKGPIDLFYSRIDFRFDRDPKGVQGLNDKRPMGTVQLREVDGKISEVVIWPASLAQRSEQLVWPFPGFTAPNSKTRSLRVEEWKY